VAPRDSERDASTARSLRNGSRRNRWSHETWACSANRPNSASDSPQTSAARLRSSRRCDREAARRKASRVLAFRTAGTRWELVRRPLRSMSALPRIARERETAEGKSNAPRVAAPVGCATRPPHTGPKNGCRRERAASQAQASAALEQLFAAHCRWARHRESGHHRKCNASGTSTSRTRRALRGGAHRAT